MAGTGRRDKHARAGGPDDVGEHGVPVVACDCCFSRDVAAPTGKPDEEAVLTEDSAQILVTKCDSTKMLFADVVFHKGADTWAVKQLVEHIVYLGHPAVRLRSDDEPPIRALLALVASEPPSWHW